MRPGLTKKTLERIKRLEHLIKLNPDMSIRELAKNMGWDAPAYHQAKRKLMVTRDNLRGNYDAQ